MGTLAVSCEDGQVILSGSNLGDSEIQIPLNTPIDLEVKDWTPLDLSGLAADGRDVVLRIEPAPRLQTPPSMWRW